MKIICHRGNTAGPNPENENNPSVVDDCIRQGYDVEIDLWFDNSGLYLGHDKPTYSVTMAYLNLHKSNLWIHCKNLFACSEIHMQSGLNYFLHEGDDYVLTSKRYVWTYPRPQNIHTWNQIMLDFSPEVDFQRYRQLGIYGVCVDYV